MSQKNVELVREAFQAWYPNDAAEFALHLDPAFEYEVTCGPEKGVYRGWQAKVDAFDQWQEPFSHYHWKADDFIDAGDDHVVIPFTEGGHGKASGVQIEQRPAFVCAVREGKILRLSEYPTLPDALESAGLRA
jgi:Ketosteroid isomerase-related protein